MEAPEDNITVGKKKGEVELINHEKNIRYFSILRKLESSFLVLILVLFILDFFKISIFLDLINYLDYDEFERHLMRYVHYGSFANFLYFIILIVCSYGSFKIYKKLEIEQENKAGVLFYVFQSLKIFVYLVQHLNFTYFLSIITLTKMIFTYKRTNPKIKH